MTREEAIEHGKKDVGDGNKVINAMFTEKAEDFLKAEVTRFVFTPKNFHWKGQEIIDYTKECIMEVGLLAGINPVETTADKTGRYSFIANVDVARMTPSGAKDRIEAVYEFDAELRFESEEANDIIYNGGKYCYNGKGTDRGEKYYNAKKKLRVAELAKFGRQKADTGAHKRAIIKMLKLPPAMAKDGDGVYRMPMTIMYISKIVPNLENSEMRRRFLDAQSGISTKIYGEHPNYIEHVEEEAEIVGFYKYRDTFKNIVGSAEIMSFILSVPELHGQADDIVNSFEIGKDDIKIVAYLYTLHKKIQSTNYMDSGKTIEQTIIEAQTDQQLAEILSNIKNTI